MTSFNGLGLTIGMLLCWGSSTLLLAQEQPRTLPVEDAPASEKTEKRMHERMAPAKPMAKPTPSMPKGFEKNVPEDYTKQAPLFEEMGNFNFDIQTEVPLAQRYFNQGMVLAFGFNHAEAARSFREVQRLDSKNPMGYWGEALVLGPNINAAMEPEDVPVAWKAFQKAWELKGNTTERLQAYLQALATRYSPEVLEDRSGLDQAYAEAMQVLVKQYPEDMDARALCAESLMDTTPWDYWLADKQPKPVTEDILKHLEHVLEKVPGHPLANHLYIHAVEAAYPEKAIPAADRLRDLVPGAGHLVHMPSHIYIRVGRYADASLANEKAIAVDENYVTQCHAQGLYPLAYMPHNRHFLWFATEMEGRSEACIQAAREVAHHMDPELMRQPGMGTLQHFSTLPLYALARFGKWEALLKAPKPAEDLKYPIGVWHFAQGLAEVRLNHFEAAEQHLEALHKLAADPEMLEVTIWDINTMQGVLQVAEKVLEGELAAGQGKWERAERALREAVQYEDALNYDEPPPWFASTRQFLGAMLIAAGKPDEAVKYYRQDLNKYPANGWSLYGLQQAFEAQGMEEKAKKAAKRFRKAWKNADVELTASRF
ncbi:TPR repeat [Planctomycetales bacterium 10988]|nr:TPR repeat [Planctomycetales bacterium 10988]